MARWMLRWLDCALRRLGSCPHRLCASRRTAHAATTVLTRLSVQTLSCIFSGLLNWTNFEASFLLTNVPTNQIVTTLSVMAKDYGDPPAAEKLMELNLGPSQAGDLPSDALLQVMTELFDADDFDQRILVFNRRDAS